MEVTVRVNFAGHGGDGFGQAQVMRERPRWRRKPQEDRRPVRMEPGYGGFGDPGGISANHQPIRVQPDIWRGPGDILPPYTDDPPWPPQYAPYMPFGAADSGDSGKMGSATP